MRPHKINGIMSLSYIIIKQNVATFIYTSLFVKIHSYQQIRGITIN